MNKNTQVCENPNNISSEHILQHWGNGVKLVNPGKEHSQSDRSVATILKNSFNVYFMDTDSQLRAINEHTIVHCGFRSERDAVGRTVHDVAKKESADNFIRNDCKTIQTNNLIITDDIFAGLQETLFFSALSMKFPWYGNNDQIIGIFGCSIILGKNSLANSLQKIAAWGLLNRPSSQIEKQHYLQFYRSEKSLNKVELTPREIEVLSLLTQGKSTKEMANQLFLSKRTIEHHIENIKNKIGVSTRYELIIKAMEYFK